MAQTRTYCPRCHQPIVADVNQLFDVNTNPDAKQQLLSGNYNIIHCPHCGYEGNLATPLVYHDPNKELLLTYFPPELGLPVNEQERLVGPLINQVVNHLPNDKRKGYLLRPQSMLTMQTMVERILEADGISREMLQAQQQRMNLLQRMLSTPETGLDEMVKAEDAIIDETFFSMLTRLIEGTLSSGDQNTARQLISLQQKLLSTTTVGKRLQSQIEETQAAVKSLQEANEKGLTREKLLDLMIAAPTETRLVTLVGMARTGMDYNFFQILSERIDKAKGDEKKRLTDLRERLLQLTQQIDREMQERLNQNRELLETLLKSENIEEAVTNNLPAISDMFIEVLRMEIDAARKNGTQDRLKKLQQILGVLQKASAPPPEYTLIEELISAENDDDRMKILQNHRDQVTPQFLDLFNNLIAQTQNEQQDPELTEHLQAAYRAALRFSMQENLKK